MQVGISTASLFMRKNNEDALPLLNELGVKTAEVFLTSFSEYNEEFGRLLLARKGNIEVNSVHVLTSQVEPQLLSAHPRVKGDAYQLLKGAMETAQILGAKYYTFHGMTRMKKYSHAGNNDNFERLTVYFDELITFCENYGVTLCLENVEWSTYNRLGVFEKLSSALPKLRGVLDIKQARISEIPYTEYIKEMGEKLAYVHISDVDEKGKMCLPGQGIFDFNELILRLKDVGFNGKFYIEVYGRDYEEFSQLKTSMEYFQELLYKYN